MSVEIMRCLIASIMLLSCGSAGLAQSSQPDAGPSDDHVRGIVLLGLENMPRLKCENRQPCAPATADEKADPPLTIPEGRAVIRRGVLSGIAEHCGLDWQRRNFVPMMAYWRTTVKKSERQLALVGVVHGITRGRPQAIMRSQGPCTDQARQSVDGQLSFRP